MDPRFLIALRVALIVAIILGGWFLAVRVGRQWLKPGHGPLWSLSSLIVVLAGVALFLLDDSHPIRSAYLWAVGFEPANQVAFALIGLSVLFVITRIIFGLTHSVASRTRRMPDLFLWFGVAPDGSPLMDFRRSLWALLSLGLVVAMAAISAMIPGNDYTLWSFCFSGMLGLLLSATHPVAPIRSRSGDSRHSQEEPLQAPRGDLEALHQWLGAPARVEMLEAVRPKPRNPIRGHRLGLVPYPYQERLCASAAGDIIPLAGPAGTGRTTAALMSAVSDALEAGRATAFFTATPGDAERILAQTHRRLRYNAASVALSLEIGDQLKDADLWFADIEQLETFLDNQTDLSGHSVIGRLGQIVIEDIERFSGLGLIRMRFLLHRLMAATQNTPRIILTGNMPGDVLERMARLLTTQASAGVCKTGDPSSTDGAHSLAVQRYIITSEDITSMDLELLRNTYKQIVRNDGVDGVLLGQHWPLYRSLEDISRSTEDVLPFMDHPPQVMLAHIGPRTAWEILGNRRFYNGIDSAEHVREYLLFERDPMSQRIESEYLTQQSWRPDWYDTRRYPRILSTAPGGRETPEGLRRLARRHLRAALSEAPQNEERLRAVFSPEIANEQMVAMREGRVTRESGWRLNPDDLKRPHLVVLVQAASDMRNSASWSTERDQILLIDYTTRLEHKVPRATVELDHYPGAIVTIEGHRFRISHQPTENERTLRAVNDHNLLTSPIRRIHCSLRTNNLKFFPANLRGHRVLKLARGRVTLRLVHTGVRDFDSRRQDRTSVHRTPEPLESSFVTSAFIMNISGANEVVLHTLTHVLREILDYFFHGASSSIGITYDLDIMGEGGLVFYEKHPDGLGFLDNINERKDIEALLTAAHHILDACQCDAFCSRCCESMTCTLEAHQSLLNRHEALAVLKDILER